MLKKVFGNSALQGKLIEITNAALNLNSHIFIIIKKNAHFAFTH